MNPTRMTLYKKWRYLAVTLPLTSGLFALLLSCGNDSTTPSSQPRAWYYEHEFTDNPGLAARPEQVVILDILPGEGLSEHPIPYLYEEGGGCLFAIPSDDPFITRTEIFDRSGVLVAATERGDGGAYLEMSPGNYSMKVYHDGAGVPEEGSAAFIRRQDEEAGRSDAVPAAGEDQGTSPINCTYPAYVAIQFLSGDYAGQYLAVTSGWVWDDGKDVDVQFMKAVSTNTTGDAFETKRHLFSFEDAEPNCCYGQTYPPFAGAYMLHSWVAETASQFFTYYLYSCSSDWGIKCPPSQNKLMSEANVISIPLFYPTQYPPTPLVQDMGGGAFLLWALADPYPIDDFTECSPLYAAENGYIYFTEFSTTASPATLTIVDGFCFYRDGSQIDRNSLGAGEVALYEGENYTGVAVLLSASFPETTLLPLEQVGSVAFGLYTDTTIRFFSDPNYTNPVKTVGVDTPSIADLSGSDIGSIKIFDSRKMLISSKECPSCNLAGVDLSNLNLDGADLSDANLMNADLHVTSLKQGNLSGALLNGANLTSVNLSGASLLNASLNADSDMNLAAATLTGAYLQNVNCKGADLGGADFTNASFHTLALAYNPAGCGQDTNNPPFTQNCASAEGANMDGARFNGAYLAGADFTGVTATAADFSGSVLTGAIFEGAHLDWDSGTGASTNFSGAFLGGANFANATVQSANFESAYIDFSTDPNEYETYFTIPVAHTQFPGFDDSFGNTPCVQFAYSSATVVPDTQSGNTCPDGSRGPCEDAAWTTPVVPSDQSPWQNSQGGKKPDWCSQVDLFW